MTETNEQVKQRLSAPGQGIFDFGVDLINMIPGVNIPKAGKYEDGLAQATRQISSVVLPTMAGTGVIRAAGVAGHARVGAGIGNLKSVQWLGNTGAAAGAGAGVGAISSEYTGDNAVVLLKRTSLLLVILFLIH